MRYRAVAAVLVLAAVAAPAPLPEGLSPQDRAEIDRDLGDLTDRVRAWRRDGAVRPDDAADVEVLAKGVSWALRYETKLEPADVALVKRALARGLERARALPGGKTPWRTGKGKLVCGYLSEVDGSVQPFGLVVPAKYDPARPMRLDVVLHGSTRPVGLSELRFLARFDEGDAGRTPPDQDYLELHPLGRVENCYRWAGETDVLRPSRPPAAATPSTGTGWCCAACRWGPRAPGTWA
jgi:hypothetical protein